MNTTKQQVLMVMITILTIGLCQSFGQNATPQWFDEEMGTIRTATVKMATNQNSRIGRMRPGAGWNYNADGGDTAYFHDGSLFLGKDSLSLSSGLFADTTSSGTGGHGDTLLGRLFCLSAMALDSTTYPSYRMSSGSGCNKDSTIAFDANFYAPRHIDSSNFMIGKFSFYAGPKGPGATINNVMVAYSLDMNIPDDSADNIGGVDSAQQMVYQASKWGNLYNQRHGAIAGFRDDGLPLVGGTVVMNSRSIDRLQGYVTDSAWTWLKGVSSFTGTDSVGDLHSILLFSRNATITPKAQGMFTIWVIFAGQPKPGGSLAGLQAAIFRARIFMCNNLNPNPALCDFYCTRCGDCNEDGVINISDAICTILYIFFPFPGEGIGDCNYPKGMGDANGDGVVNISDAVYLIAYVFAGGTAPHCQGM